MKSWPELHQRLLDLAETLREHGIVWRPFVVIGARVRRGSRIPPVVVAEMKSLLEELRALVRATTDESEVTSLVRRCRELAREYPEKSAKFQALADRSQRERTAPWEEHELLLAEAMGMPVWGGIELVEPGAPAPFEIFSDFPPGDDFHRPEPTPQAGFMDLWRLVLAWESGALEEEPPS